MGLFSGGIFVIAAGIIRGVVIITVRYHLFLLYGALH